MSATPVPRTSHPVAPSRIPPLQNGDRLTRAEFERRFDATPGLKKAELIEGRVYMPPPISDSHSAPHFDLILWLGTYRAEIPEVLGGDNGSLRLDLDNMPQPDAFLRISEKCGGQSRLDADDYVEGAPELIAEVAVSSASYDLHEKLNAYRRNGVREYLVWRVLDRAIDYFVLKEGRFDRVAPSPDGLLRSEVLPGLWLDPAALLRRDMRRVLEVVKLGLNTPEHKDFVAKLRTAQE